MTIDNYSQHTRDCAAHIAQQVLVRDDWEQVGELLAYIFNQKKAGNDDIVQSHEHQCSVG